MLHAMMLSLLIGQVPVSAPVVMRPDWIATLPEVQGRLYGLGLADLGANQGQALARAADSARLEVVTRIRTSVKRQTSTVVHLSELAQGDAGVARYGDRHTRNTTSVTAQAEDLPGLVVEKTFVDPAGRTAYALAYLDLGQAEKAMTNQLSRIADQRAAVGDERSRKARWRLRKVKGDLGRLEETMSLLALTGAGLALRPSLQKERSLVETQLSVLEKDGLPPLDFSKLAVGLRTNIELPAGMDAYLNAQIEACGLMPRGMAPDLILEVAFKGGDGGAEFISTDLDVYQGVTYRLEAQVRLLEQGGEVLGKPVPIKVVQSASPEGMVKEFRRQMERSLPNLFFSFRPELE
jgi:hypothetical protein